MRESNLNNQYKVANNNHNHDILASNSNRLDIHYESSNPLIHYGFQESLAASPKSTSSSTTTDPASFWTLPSPFARAAR